MKSLRERIKEIEREEIIRALMTSNWVMSRAARKLGITERMIGYKVRKYNIIKEEVAGVQENRFRSNEDKKN